jgi:uncharacterized protein (TIGR00725 family)
MRNKLIIAVIGAGQATQQEIKLAEAVGREIAARDAVLVCGGMNGVMEAACRGAVEKGGLTVGILPGDKRETANPYVQIPIITGMGQARNVIVVKTAQAVIAVGGSYGTLSEIGHALQNGIPVIGLKTWSLTREKEQDGSIIYVENPAEAVKLAIELIKKEGES